MRRFRPLFAFWLALFMLSVNAPMAWAAFTASAVIEVQTGGSDSTGVGVFDPGVAGMDATASVASANTSAPVVTVNGEAAGDVNMWFYLKSATSSLPGWYKISSVDTTNHKYTINATIGSAVLANGTLNTVTGCCSTGTTLSSVTWAVDYSQTTGNITTGTASSSTTTLTATTAIFRKPMVGNGVTNGTAWRVITAYTSTTVVTVDSAPAWTSQSISIGGALASPAQAWSLAVNRTSPNSNRIWVKAGSGYSTAANIAANKDSVTMQGYSSIRGDSGRATITATTGCTIIIAASQFNCYFRNLILDCGSSVANTGITVSSNEVNIQNVWVKNFLVAGFALGTSSTCEIVDCEMSASQSGATAGITGSATNLKISGCYIHGNLCPASTLSGNAQTWTNNIIYSNTGTSSDGLTLAGSYGHQITNNTFYGNGRDGIRLQNYQAGTVIRNNIFVSNGASTAGYGINCSNAQMQGSPIFNYNAFFGNATGLMNQINTGANDVTLGADPVTNAAGGNFKLNNNATGGRLSRHAGIPGTPPGLSATKGYLDIGAVQHSDLVVNRGGR